MALVVEGDQPSFSDLARAGAALKKQVTRDFGPIWSIDATVDAFATLDDVPLGYWPVIIKADIQNDNALGYHVDKNGQPFALVKYTTGWETTCSHEVLEMLVIPSGTRWSLPRRSRRGRTASSISSRSAIRPRRPSTGTA